MFKNKRITPPYENSSITRVLGIDKNSCHSELVSESEKKKAGFTLLVKPFARACRLISLRSRKSTHSQTKCYSYGFTLAETMIILIILGVIASLTIPAVVSRHREAVNRAKIKKAMTAYDTAVRSMVVEHNLRNMDALENWADDAADACANTTVYFIKSEGAGCTFKTAEGLWWNIDDITKPIVAFKQDDLTADKAGDNNSNDAFYFVTSYDSANKMFMINNLPYETSINGEVAALTKLDSFTKPENASGDSDTETVGGGDSEDDEEDGERIAGVTLEVTSLNECDGADSCKVVDYNMIYDRIMLEDTSVCELISPDGESFCSEVSLGDYYVSEYVTTERYCPDCVPYDGNESSYIDAAKTYCENQGAHLSTAAEVQALGSSRTDSLQLLTSDGYVFEHGAYYPNDPYYNQCQIICVGD